MEPEETGLTVAERIMFLILGLALLLVGAILIFGNIKNKNKQLKEETKVTETANNDEVKNETVSDDSAKKEEENTEKDSKNGEKSESDSVTEDSKKSSSDNKSEDNSDTQSKEEITKSPNESQNSTTEKSDTPKTRVPNTRADDETVVLAASESKEELPQVPHTKVDDPEEELWNLPENIVLDAYEGETIVVNKTVVNKNGQTESAQVTVRKLEGNSYNIVDTRNNRFVASKGTYKYYYTHNSVTKVATLHVDEKAANVNFSPLASFDYVENDEFTKYELTSMIDNSKGTNITKEDNVYVINIVKANKTNYSALLINTGEKIETIKSNTKGIYIGSEYSTLWNDNYDSGIARVIVNLNYINSGEIVRLRVNINGTEKAIEVKFIITEKKEEKEELESDNSVIDNNLLNNEKEPTEEEQNAYSEFVRREELPMITNEKNTFNVEESNDLNQSLDRT